MDKPKFAPNSGQGNTIFMHLTHATTYLPYALLLLYLLDITNSRKCNKRNQGIKSLKDKIDIFNHPGQGINNFHEVNQLKTHQRCGGEKFRSALGDPTKQNYFYC